jgi:predicted kinase
LVEILRRPSFRPKLVVLCGPSHAGKTAFADKLADAFTVVSAERIRQRLGLSFGRGQAERAVWTAFEQEKRAALRERQNVLLDACHMSPEARWHSVQGAGKRHGKALVLFDVPLELALARCSAAGRLSPEEAERMWWAFEKSKPTRAELETLGFDWAYVLRDRAQPARPGPLQPRVAQPPSGWRGAPHAR